MKRDELFGFLRGESSFIMQIISSKKYTRREIYRRSHEFFFVFVVVSIPHRLSWLIEFICM